MQIKVKRYHFTPSRMTDKKGGQLLVVMRM